MSMEKITKDELLEKIGGTPLPDEELEQISAGGDAPSVKSVCKQIADKHCIRVIDSAGYKGS